jgi:2-iminobutanoate/2-iminopropanoate deaminase
MSLIQHNPEAVFPPYRAYSHAVEVRGNSRLLFISGLNGYEKDGTTMPESFEEQAELVWAHLRAILASADMTLDNIVSLRTYLSDPKYDEHNVHMRMKYMGNHRPASTVVCSQLLEPRWKLEVEAVAASAERCTDDRSNGSLKRTAGVIAV